MIDIGFTSDGVDHFSEEYAIYENKWVELPNSASKGGSSGRIIGVKKGYFYLLPYSHYGNKKGYYLKEDGDPEAVPIAGTTITPSSKEKILEDMRIINERNSAKQMVEDVETHQKLIYLGRNL